MRIKKIINIIFRSTGEETSVLDRNIDIYGSIFLSAISLLLTFVNINKRFWFMTCTTGALAAGFIIAAVTAAKNRLSLSRIIITIMCGITFSIYAITGENEGFAILWILLVPLLGSYIVGLKNGFLLGAYFQLFLIVLFYTPLSNIVKDYYTSTFILRFPMLYFATFGGATIVICQLRELLAITHRQSYYDDLTGLHNRAYYNQFIAKADELPDISVIVMDLNRLKYVNDTLGHEAGDKMIIEAAQHILSVFGSDTCCRIGGDEFVVICDHAVTEDRLGMFRAIAPDISLGCARRKDSPDLTFVQLSKQADAAMYKDKAAYYKQKGLDRRR